MKVFRRSMLLIVFVSALIVLTMIPALAQDSGSSNAGTIEPAVTVTTPAAAAPNLDWTYRYMIPAGLVLGVVVIVVTAGQYFISVVRKRYRIVDE